MSWEIVGLEVHLQLATQSKFSLAHRRNLAHHRMCRPMPLTLYRYAACS